MRAHLLLSLFLLSCAGAKLDDTRSPSSAGPSAEFRAMELALSRGGFLCKAPAPALRGMRCRGMVAGYSRAVNIFVPAFLDRSRPLAVAYHLHGWWTSDEFNPFQTEYGDFGAYLTESGRNAVVVVPESSGRNATYAEQWTSADRFHSFLKSVDRLLVEGGLAINADTPRLLSGHSGAYIALGNIGEWAAAGKLPSMRGLRGVALLDSAYGFRSGLVRFKETLARNDGWIYLLSFNPNDGSAAKARTNQQIYQGIKKTTNGKAVLKPDPGAAHMRFMSRHFAEFLKLALPAR